MSSRLLTFPFGGAGEMAHADHLDAVPNTHIALHKLSHPQFRVQLLQHYSEESSLSVFSGFCVKNQRGSWGHSSVGITLAQSTQSPGFNLQYFIKPGMVAHTCKPNIQSVEARGLIVQGLPQLHREWEASLGYARACLKMK